MGVKENLELMKTLDDSWKNGEITEERLFYDVVGMMKQLGLM